MFATPTKSGQNIFRLACLFIGRFWGGKSTFFGILKQWKITYKIFAYFPYQKFVSQKQCKIITKTLPYFSYQKIAFQKQGKITTKNLPYFSYQKINVWRPPPNQGRIFSSNFSLLCLPKISKYLIRCHMGKRKIFLFLWIHVEKKIVMVILGWKQ